MVTRDFKQVVFKSKFYFIVFSLQEQILSPPHPHEVPDWGVAIPVLGQVSGVTINPQGQPVIFHRGPRVLEKRLEVLSDICQGWKHNEDKRSKQNKLNILLSIIFNNLLLSEKCKQVCLVLLDSFLPMFPALFIQPQFMTQLTPFKFEYIFSCFNDSNIFQHAAEGAIPVDTILTLDPDSGSVISAWGRNLFFLPHGIHVDWQGNTWVTDIALHQVLKVIIS